MDAERLEIARRFAACPKWDWLPGMQAVGTLEFGNTQRKGSFPVAYFEDRTLRCLTSLKPAGRGSRMHFGLNAIFDPLPNLNDPVTAAGILPVVRRAWGRDMWVRESEEGGYICEALCKSPALTSMEQFGVGPSELLALLAALDAAP